MAKGETFLLQTKWDNKTFLTPGICSSELLSSAVSGDIFALNKTGTLNEIYDFIDTVLTTSVWQLAVFPIYQDDDYKWAELRKVFPGITRVLVKPDNAEFLGPDDTIIPDARLIMEESTYNGVAYLITSRSTLNGNKIAFPQLVGYGYKGLRPAIERDGVTTRFLIFPDDGIDEGKIVADKIKTTNSYAPIAITIESNDDGSYYTLIDWPRGGSTSWPTNAYWDGQVIRVPPSNDPFAPGGETPQTPGGTGGTGNFDGSSTDVGIPDEPSLSATSGGFISLFNPSLLQLTELSNFMWSDLFDIDTLKKLFADPMQAILGLSIIPGPIPSAGSSEVKVGNIGTGVTMNKAARQYITIDCGSLNVNEYWGAYLDYDPYTKCEIYLPYIGTHAIAADDIMGKTVQVVYRVDILSGACMAYIKCGGSVLYQFAGQCSASVPITGNDWTNVINGTLSVAANIGSLVASGGATAPLAANSLANAAVNQMKPSVEKSGSLSGAAGIMGIQQPYLIITRPRQALPYKQNTYSGYPSLYSVKLSDLKGYTEVEKIHLEGIPATEKELAEIDTLLKGGVIF